MKRTPNQESVNGSTLNKNALINIVFCLLVFILLLITSRFNYLIFHTLAEFFSIVVAWGIFIILWNTREIVQNKALIFLGIAYFFIGGIDLIHTISYKGMGVLGAESGADPATQLWILARYTESISLCVLPFLIRKRLNLSGIFLIYFAVFSIGLLSIFYWEIFPACYIEEKGLTAFKIYSEYLICLLLISALISLRRHKRMIDASVVHYMTLAIIFTMLGELAFTFYVDVYDFSNLVGHFCKILSFYFVYKSIVQIGLTAPYRLLFKEIAETENKYRQIFEANQAIKLLINPSNGAIIEANKAACEFYGYSKEQIESQTIFDINVSDDEAIQGNLEMAASESQTVFHSQHRLASCEIRYVEVYSGPIFHNDQILLYSIVQDISDRKKAQTEMIKQKELFQSVFNSQKDAIFILNSDIPAIVIECNQAAVDMFGYSTEEFIDYETSHLHVDAKHLKYFQDRLFQTIENKKSLINYPFFMKRKNGTVFPTEHTVLERKNDAGDREGWISIVKDMSEIKAAEESSRRLKDRLESLWNITKIADSNLKTISDHVLEEVQKMTQSQYAFYGFLDGDESEMTLHAWSHQTMDECETDVNSLHFPIDRAGIWAEAVRNQKVLTINDFKRSHPGKKGLPHGHIPIDRIMAVPFIKDGKVISIAAVANKTVDYTQEDKNQVKAFLGNVQLLLDRKVAEKENIEIAKRLQQLQKMESIGNLAGGIAHDFNNLLFPIVGMAELLIEDLPLKSPERENAQEILRAGLRGSDLVKQILAFSRQSEHQLLPTRIQNILKEVLKLSRSTIPSYIEFEQNIQSDCGMVRADATQIHQVAMNIITNAYHAMDDKGGRLSVKLREIELKETHMPQVELPLGKYALLSISDTGHGMSAELIQKIFEPYFTTKDQDKGTGLGLAVVHGIVKAHNGDIEVLSKIGEGSTFNVYLPLMEKMDNLSVIHSNNHLETGHERILLVDDEEPIAKLEKQILERLGYHVTMRINSLEALEWFKNNSQKVDLIISDMAMPNMSGDKLSSEIKSIRPGVPVILCTGYSDRIEDKNTKEMGIDALLMKPIIKSDLAHMVRKVIDESKNP